MMGLVLAAQRFEPERGRFANYASSWIRARIFHFLAAIAASSKRPPLAPRARCSRDGRASRAPMFDSTAKNQTPKPWRAFELDVGETRELLASLFTRDVAYDANEHELAADTATPEAALADRQVEARALRSPALSSASIL